jgi:hypothetical protein
MHLKKAFFTPFTGAMIGTAVFFIIYGYRILDPTFIAWTLHQDAAQHFIGWHFFRSEPWTFPLGLLRSFPYPQGTSIVYTDSIPLIAIPLKLFAPLLPHYFQYHGIWLLLSYTLQGLFAWILLAGKIRTRIFIVFGTVLITLSPILAQRAEIHEALTAQWVILAGLCLYYRPVKTSAWIQWLILLLAASAIHFSLLFMVAMIWLAFIIRNVMAKTFLARGQGKQGRRAGKDIVLAVATVPALLLFMWILGYFVIGIKQASEGGFGFFSMNLLAPFNPAPFSTFLFFQPMALSTEGQNEGFNYLGIGMMFLIIASLYGIIKAKFRFNKARDFPILVICLIIISKPRNISCFLARCGLRKAWDNQGKRQDVLARMLYPCFYFNCHHRPILQAVCRNRHCFPCALNSNPGFHSFLPGIAY